MLCLKTTEAILNPRQNSLGGGENFLITIYPAVLQIYLPFTDVYISISVRSSLFLDVTHCGLVTDVCEQPISPTFKGHDGTENVSRNFGN